MTPKEQLKQELKQERLAHANALIRVIASHGRRFFWHGGNSVWNAETKTQTFEPCDRYARLELRRGKVYFIDDYTQKPVFTQKTTWGSRWRGFSHGGTLRSLVEDMRDYVLHGTPVARWKIAIPRAADGGVKDNIWGYDEAAAQAVRDAAFKLPIMAAG